MKEVLFIRNAPIIISHDDTIKNKKEIAEALRDLNLAIAKNFNWLERDDFVIYIHLFKNLLSYPDILNYYQLSRNLFGERKYVGNKASDIMFYFYRDYSVNVIICQNSNIYNTYHVNESNILIDLDSEYEIFTDDEVRRLLSYSNKDIQNIQKNENVYFLDDDVYYQGTITPIVLNYKGNRINIGFFNYPRITWKPMIILHLKKNILKDRNVLGKLLCYFINMDSFNLNLGYRNQKDIYINFNRRIRKELVSNTINVDHDAKYDRIFNGVTIGVDFGCAFINKKGEYLSALRVVDNYIKYIFFYDLDRYEEEFNKLFTKSKIGVDWNHRIGKCRTDVYYANKNGCQELIREIEDLILILKDYADHSGCLITFSSEDYQNMAHLHLGFEFDKKSLVRPNFALLLDLSLGSYLVTLNTEVGHEEAHSEYNNCEYKDYGFEYRGIPSAVIYNGLYKYVIEIYYKLIEHYFYKSYFTIELDSDGKLSKKFFEKLLGRATTKKYFELINELRDSLHKKILYLKYPFLNAQTLFVKKGSFYDYYDYFTPMVKELIVDLNLNYVKNGIVFFYGPNSEKSDNNITPVELFKELPESVHYSSKIPYLEDYSIIKIISRLRGGKDNEEIYNLLSESIYKLLKNLEKKNILVEKSENIFIKLSEKYGFNIEKVVV